MYVGFLNESVFWNLQTFQWSCAIETGLDFLKMGMTVMKMHYPKRKPRIITYRKYKNFCNEIFLTSLQHEVDKPRTFLCENGLDATSKICTYVIETTRLVKKDVYEQITNLLLTLKSYKR